MLKPLTLQQSLYWQRESLHDARWSLDKRIASQEKRGRQPRKLLSDRAGIVREIFVITARMNAIESGNLAVA